MRIIPFDAAGAATVASWARTVDEVRAWCSRSEVPVDPAVVAAWGQAADVTAYGFVDGDALVGYGETWVDHEEAEVELARLIVEPARRGLGVGRRMVAGLTTIARREHPSVLVRVHPDNAAALRCYAAAGFVRVPAGDETQWNVGQPVAFAWLAHRDPAR